MVKRPLFSQAGLNSLYTVEPTGSSVYLSAQVCAKGICWYNYITYFFVLLVTNKKVELAIPLQLTEVGVSSPIEDEKKVLMPKDTEYVVIEGGNHSQFGYYGLQSEDNVAKITREEQQSIVVLHISNFLTEVEENR